MRDSCLHKVARMVAISPAVSRQRWRVRRPVESQEFTLFGCFDPFRVLPGARGSGVAGSVHGYVIQMPARSPKGCGGIMRRLLLVVVILLICAGAAAAQQTSGSASPATASAQATSNTPQAAAKPASTEAATFWVPAPEERWWLPKGNWIYGYAQFDLAPPHNEPDPNFCAANAGNYGDRKSVV